MAPDHLKARPFCYPDVFNFGSPLFVSFLTSFHLYKKIRKFNYSQHRLTFVLFQTYKSDFCFIQNIEVWCWPNFDYFYDYFYSLLTPKNTLGGKSGLVFVVPVVTVTIWIPNPRISTFQTIFCGFQMVWLPD